MTYVMSDMHGEFERYMTMLEKIGFSDADTLYIIGDVIDRGPEPVKILRHMAMCSNIFPIMGNHEAMAIAVLDRLLCEITEENYGKQLDTQIMHALLDWQLNGGNTTLEALRKQTNADREDLLAYMKEFPLYETVDVGDRTFLFVHAGLGHFRVEKRLGEYTADELLWGSPDLTKAYFPSPDIYVVCGHTPTMRIHGKAEIYHHARTICIDCGAAIGGCLACLCLDTMQEYYV